MLFLKFIFKETAVIIKFEREPRNRKDCLSEKTNAVIRTERIVATEYMRRRFSYRIVLKVIYKNSFIAFLYSLSIRTFLCIKATKKRFFAKIKVLS